jgi:hypothetical protein
LKRWLILSAVAAAGCGLLWYMAPRAHPAAEWRVSCDREQSQVRAREISASLGVDTAGWIATVAGDTDSKAGYFAEHHRGLTEAKRFSPVFPEVLLKSPRDASRVLVKLSASGDFNRWEWKGYAKTTALEPAQAEAVARRAMSTLLGNHAAAFREAQGSTQNGDRRVIAFERTEPVAERFEAEVDGSQLVKAELNPVYDAPSSGGLQLSSNLSSRKKYINWFTGVVGVLIYFGGTALAAGVYVFWAVRRAVRHRFVLALSGTAILYGAVYWLNWQQFKARYGAGPGVDSLEFTFLGNCLILLLLILLLVVLAGATDAIGLRPKLVTLRSVFSGSAFNRQAGFSIAAGLLCGPLLAALPLAVSWLRLFGSERTGDYEANLMFSAHPAVQALDVMWSVSLLGIFGFGAGFLDRYIRKPWLSRTLLAVAGILLFSTTSQPSETAPVAFVLSGVLLFAGYYTLFQRLDLLAALSAGWCAQAIWNASALAVQPAAALRSSATAAFLSLAAASACAALVAWRGRELAATDAAAPAVVTSRREALMKEFSIAHRVQQQMLPEHPPEIPGCTLAASCQPAQEVGGDLFDFLRLPDGRWSIGVGDVSGKGVHAALYMTLTKGLLMATTGDSSDLVDIVGNVNGHIHAATEKKTFVTLALGAFDPESRSFDHVRAGHNPIVWRNASSNSTSLLNAPGLGLGIVADRLFRRSVKLGRVQLSAGDALVLYSDGVTEAMNAEREQFGEERLMRAVEDADGMDAGGVQQRILARVKEFLAGVAPQDDMTIVVLRVN